MSKEAGDPAARESRQGEDAVYEEVTERMQIEFDSLGKWFPGEETLTGRAGQLTGGLAARLRGTRVFVVKAGRIRRISDARFLDLLQARPRFARSAFEWAALLTPRRIRVEDVGDAQEQLNRLVDQGASRTHI